MRFQQADTVLPPAMERVFYVGCVHLSILPTNPAEYLGLGTWQLIAAGRALVGVDAGDPDFDAPGKLSGAKTVTLTGAQSGVAAHSHGVTDPGHSHVQRHFPTATGGSTGQTVDTSMSGTQTNSALSTASATTGITVNNAAAADAAQAHNNVQPSYALYVWTRTA